MYDKDPGPEESPKLPINLKDIFILELPGNVGALEYDTSLLPSELNILPTHPSDPKSDHIAKVYRDSLENYVFFQYGDDDSNEEKDQGDNYVENKRKLEETDFGAVASIGEETYGEDWAVEAEAEAEAAVFQVPAEDSAGLFD